MPNIFKTIAVMDDDFAKDVVKTAQVPREDYYKARLPGQVHMPGEDVKNLEPRKRGCHY